MKHITRRDMLATLRSYLNAKEPRIVRWLVRTWNAERDAIKYDDLEYAVLNKEVPLEWLLKWQQDYSTFVTDVLDKEWRDAIQSGGKEVQKRIREVFETGENFSFTPTGQHIEQWITTRGGELIVNLTQKQLEAVRAVLRHYTVEAPVSPQELGRILRPIIGLTPKQATAVQRFRDSLIVEGVSMQQVEKQTLRYATQLHRFRAERIARTELALAYNHGQYEAIRQAQEQGIIQGKVLKEWLTADDERVCEFCGPLDGQVIGFEETFVTGMKSSMTTLVPPAHPLCRCSVGYRVVE